MANQLFKSYPHLKRMGKYSKQVAKLLFQQYPLWFPFSEVQHDDHDDYYFVVKINAPVNPSDMDLVFETRGERITVHFDRFHAHFGGWTGMTYKDAFDDAMIYLEKLFKEEYFVGIKMDEQGLVTGRGLTKEKLDSIDPNLLTYTRSWLGTYDRTIS